MTRGNKESVLDALAAASAPLCDDCLAANAGVHPRQTVFQLCTALAAANRIVRERRPCKSCGKSKNTSVLPTGNRDAALAAPLADVAAASAPALKQEKSWHWEGNVQIVLAAFLEREGWRVVSKADTASRKRGIDIVATKDGRLLVVEVKGYPSTTYERGPKQGEAKATSPSSQARQWFSHALLSGMLLRHKRPEAEIALCFPDFKTFRGLAAGTRACLEELRFGTYFVSKNGGVVLDLPHQVARPAADAAVRSARRS
jgi:hypothetical protein